MWGVGDNNNKYYLVIIKKKQLQTTWSYIIQVEKH